MRIPTLLGDAARPDGVHEGSVGLDVLKAMVSLKHEGKALPCVIYCHGNSGCRADAGEAAIILLPSNITVFTLDFSGSGRSGGEHVTLGWNEKEDLRAVVDYLRADGNVSLIGLWGRSMGAVTRTVAQVLVRGLRLGHASDPWCCPCLMYGAEDPSIAGMVLDSPFSDLVDLMMELVDTYKVRLPKFTVKFAINYMRRAILKKAKFDITELNTIKVAKSSFVPVLFGHAVDDDFIQPHHSDRIFDAYVDSWSNLPEVGYANDDFVTASVDPATSSTEEAINQLRSKRPMSRMEVPSDISSKDNQSEAKEEGSGTKPVPSSSKMINFEFTNGHHVPTSIDDDEYIEYPLDNLADFPSNVEEEERMFMKAVIESLKDLDMRPSNLGEQTSSADTDHPNKALRDEKPDKSSTTDHSVSSSTESNLTVAANEHHLASQLSSPETSVSSVGLSPSTDTPLLELGTTGNSGHSDASTDVKTSSDAADMVDCTKATVTVVKNPSSNIIDGLMRRWDLNFFRNSR
ncbi:alpha/beta-Hydrolases superfamily protein [Actinidia rufa]|uniref:Alpha/beta-Hydrolases superfamily protein n=1 Tax=Actinidia rufa TaxID=165716 RepID=A0A7J0GTH1_9ERIC|nr:alpha/beta-Hydrolases superfamily protein [Actinidia rufa]